MNDDEDESHQEGAENAVVADGKEEREKLRGRGDDEEEDDLGGKKDDEGDDVQSREAAQDLGESSPDSAR